MKTVESTWTELAPIYVFAGSHEQYKMFCRFNGYKTKDCRLIKTAHCLRAVSRARIFRVGNWNDNQQSDVRARDISEINARIQDLTRRFPNDVSVIDAEI